MSEKRKGAIPIAAAKKVSQEHGCPIVLIFAIEADGCHYTVTTYGQTKPLCAWAAKLSSDIQQAVMAGKVLGDVEHAHNPYELIATLRRDRDEARVENERLRGIIRWGLSYADNNAPSPPDHLCGHPDACCDGNCADFATYQQWKAQAASAAKEGGR